MKNIDDIKKKHEELKNKILTLIYDFEQQTDTKVSDIEYNRFVLPGGERKYNLKLTIKI